MKPSLQIRQSQHLALTPQLQQSIRLLQLSTLELNQEIEQILAANPMLDRIDDPYQADVRLHADGSLQSNQFDQPATAPATMSCDFADRGHDGAMDNRVSGGDGDGLNQFADRQDISADQSDRESEMRADAAMESWGSDSGGRQDDGDDDRGTHQIGPAGVSLQSHLQQQAAGLRGTVRDRALVELLIGELEDSGYLETPLEELLASLPEELDIELEDLQTALRLLQSFDPVGVGARSIPECLSLQLSQAAAKIGADAGCQSVAQRIIHDHLELLAAREFSKLRKLLRCDEMQLRDAQRLIQSLDPKPGNRFSDQAPAYVIPDVVVRKTRQGWQAFLNPEVIPRLRVNDVYAQILRNQRSADRQAQRAARQEAAATAEVPSGTSGPADGVQDVQSAPHDPAASAENKSGAGNNLSTQLQEARWLVKNVQQRFETILRVSQEIVDRQKAYFSHGAVAMRPLVLREVADAVGLHESTISRVTTQKYMLTPFGTVELKYFFGSHVATETGGAASSTAIRALIRQLIEEEDTTQPLSDSRIAEVLGEQGIVVARRTVAKYREALRVPPVAQRRAL